LLYIDQEEEEEEEEEGKVEEPEEAAVTRRTTRRKPLGVMQASEVEHRNNETVNNEADDAKKYNLRTRGAAGKNGIRNQPTKIEYFAPPVTNLKLIESMTHAMYSAPGRYD
jgi:hypothetical protein